MQCLAVLPTSKHKISNLPQFTSMHPKYKKKLEKHGNAYRIARSAPRVAP